jgi:hypothetical protein
MPRYFGQGAEVIIQNGLADLGSEVLRDHSDRRNHLSSFLEIIDAHERITAASQPQRAIRVAYAVYALLFAVNQRLVFPAPRPDAFAVASRRPGTQFSRGDRFLQQNRPFAYRCVK